MSVTSLLPDLIQQAFKPTQRGVVGLVDDLLGACRDQQLRLDFQDGHCSVRCLNADPRNAITVPLQKSVFRAVLARVAALCNERVPNSVTPYRGEGELSACSNPPALFHAQFTNTPSEQWLELRFLAVSNEGTKELNGLAGDAALTPSPSAS